MEAMPDPFDLYSLTLFALFVWAAWMTGRAVALAWRPAWTLAFYLLVLAAAARFLQHALFGQTLLSLQSYLVALALFGVVGALAYRVTRVRQMTTRYRWLHEAGGSLSWRVRPRGAGGA